MLLYCIRHAESAYNAVGRIQGQSDPPLSDDGEKQAAALAEYLAEAEIDAIFSSPLRRAADTARPIAEALNLALCIDERLMELDVGVFQDKTWEEVEEQYPEAAAAWRSRDPEFAIPGGESRRMLMERAHGAFESIHNAGCERVLVVAHGGTLTAAFKSLLGIPAERNPISLLNASISVVRWPDNGEEIKLLTLNETLHLGRIGATTRCGDLG